MFLNYQNKKEAHRIIIHTLFECDDFLLLMATLLICFVVY